jgi:hypothetical protein
MRNQPERIESVASVAAGLGTPEMKVLNLAGERAAHPRLGWAFA